MCEYRFLCVRACACHGLQARTPSSGFEPTNCLPEALGKVLITWGFTTAADVHWALEAGAEQTVKSILTEAKIEKGLTTTDHDVRHKDVLAKYPSRFIFGATLPAMGYLQSIYGQSTGRHSEWVPMETHVDRGC